jgi:hypothetical protein
MVRRVSGFWFTMIAVVVCAIIVCQAQPQWLSTRHVRSVVLDGQAAFIDRRPANQSMLLDI